MENFKYSVACFLLYPRFIYKFFRNRISHIFLSPSEKKKIQQVEDQLKKAVLTNSGEKIAIYWASGWTDAVLLDVGNFIELEKSGYRIILACPNIIHLVRLYRMAGIKHFVNFESCLGFLNPFGVFQTLRQLDRNDVDIFNLKYCNNPVGKFSLSTFFRITRRGDYKNLNSQEINLYKKCMFLSIVAFETSAKLIRDINPSLVIGSDRGYTPQAELFECTLNMGIPFVTWNVGHKNNTIIFKRYNQNNKHEHPYGLSESSWSEVKTLPDSVCSEAMRELEGCYKNQSWFKEVGTQFNTDFFTKEQIRKSLNLPSMKKVVCLFPHIFWDATFFWGNDLFANYQEWFEAVCLVAKEKTDVEWIIKIHPSNKFKNARDGYQGNFQEKNVLDKIFKDNIPNHIHILYPDTKINTISLIKAIDYCLTVRGTIGMECASLGVRVLTCGTGRYDKKGFTLDFENKEGYIRALKVIEQLPIMKPEEITLAQKFLYGSLIYRTYKNPYLEFDYLSDSSATLVSKLTLKTTRPESKSVHFFCSNYEDFTN